MTIGIDIGGTNLSFGQVRDGKILQMFSTPSFPAEATLEETLDHLTSHVRKIFTRETKKIGIGVPSVVDVNKGIVYDTQNIPSWKEVPLKEYMEDVFQVPVAVNNDANCYAMGIYGKYPAAAKPESLVAVTLGTGVGMGIVIDGKLYSGVNCGAGEVGCLPYKDSILEDYCSKKYFTGLGTDAKALAKAAAEGNSDALIAFHEFGRHMGFLVCAVLYAYDPSHIALGGGIANSYPYFCQSMTAFLKEYFPYRKTLEKLKVDIFTDNDIPVIGASLI
ncbi:MAG: ROK family protein [Bacteroidales bacterium]|nr:ROK family protein [Bacteroidales bacterium]